MAYPLPGKASFDTLNGTFADVTTAGSIYIPVPYQGTIRAIHVAVNAALTGADTVITPYVGSTQLQLNGSTVTLTLAYATSAAGSVFTLVPTGKVEVQEGDVIRLASDGGSSNGSAVVAIASVLIDQTTV